MHHAHHIIQRARDHVSAQREDREMAKHEKSEQTPEQRTAELRAAAVAKGKQSLAELPANAPRLNLSK